MRPHLAFFLLLPALSWPTVGAQSKLSDNIPPVQTALSIDSKDLQGVLSGWTSWNVNDPQAPLSIQTQFSSIPLCEKLQGSSPCTPETDTLYVVHVLESKDSPAARNGPILTSSSWWAFVYDEKKKCFRSAVEHGQDSDIFQGKKVVLFSISRIITTSTSSSPAPSPSYAAQVTKQQKANTGALVSLFVGLGQITLPKPPAGALEAAAVNYRFQVVSFPATKYDPPFTWALTAAAAGTASVGATDASGCGNLVQNAKCSFTQSFPVLDREWWSIGINIVPYGPRENIYSQSSSGTITQKHTIHSPFYGVADIDPFYKYWTMDQGPYLQAGLPFSGAAFHLPYVGFAQSLHLGKSFPVPVSVFGGVVFMKQTFPRTLQVGQTESTSAFNADLKTDRARKPLYGVEVPLSTLISKVKSSIGK